MRTTEQEATTGKRPRHAHIFDRDADDRYVEPLWVSARLFAVERFVGTVHDPAAGTAQVVKAAKAAGLRASGSDITPCVPGISAIDFLADTRTRPNIISNPPYNLLRPFAEHALTVTRQKVALLLPLARLNAAGRWLEHTPLRRVWLLTPRPSIPPHCLILEGQKPQGGRVDFCWWVWEQGFGGAPTIHWLCRDADK